MGAMEGKSVVVTGSARGLGEAYVRALVAEGAAVVVNDIDAEPAEALVAALQRAGGTAVAHNGDVASWDFAASLIERCVSEFGKIDGLVNNAGVFVLKPIDEQDEASFRRQFEVNVFGQAWCGLHALRRMMPQKSGAIVNVFSGAQAGSALRCAYSAATSAIAGLTYSWAAECAGTGVRVNAIAPIAATREIEESEVALQRLAAQGRVSAGFANLREKMKSLTTEMNAPMVVYLLSDAAAGVTGQALRFTGKELMLLTRPAVRSPMLAEDGWTAEKIERAFAGEWQDKLLPLGLAEYRMELVRALG
jgi:NAD(P)-dependent dehydrogenase (short-subunit alcohol dehydrogenase family)